MVIVNQGETRKVVALFMDIRGFSHMFEMLPAEKVYMFTNRYFKSAYDIIVRYKGMLDNIVGDGLLAIWGKEKWLPKSPFYAVRAALEMRMALLRQNIQYKWEAHFPLEIGVGVAMGEALHCIVGPAENAIDTFFGSPVILASRLGDLARHNNILVDDQVAKTVRKWAKLEDMPEKQIQGFKKKLPLFRVEGLMDFSLKAGERRKTSFIRYVFPEIIALVMKKNGMRKPVILKNISATGAGIEIVQKDDYDLNEDDEIMLDLRRFQLPDFDTIDGRIVQIRSISEESDIERRLSQLGIAFTNIDPMKSKLLEQLNIA